MIDSKRDRSLLRVSQECVAAFVSRGDSSLTVAELAELAGVSERTFYRYFVTKEECIRPVLDEGNRALCQALAREADGAGLAAALARSFAHSMTIFETRTRELMPIIFHDPALLLIWQAVSFDTVALIRPEVARLIGEPAHSIAAGIAAGQAVVAVVSALTDMAEAQAEIGPAIERAIAASRRPFFALPTGAEPTPFGHPTTPFTTH